MSSFPTQAYIREIFAHLERGDGAAFYENVADDVSWTVMGSHALSGHFPDKKTFLSTSAGPIVAVIDGPLNLQVRRVIGGETEDWAVIELLADAKCKNGRCLPLIRVSRTGLNVSRANPSGQAWSTIIHTLGPRVGKTARLSRCESIWMGCS